MYEPADVFASIKIIKIQLVSKDDKWPIVFTENNSYKTLYFIFGKKNSHKTSIYVNSTTIKVNYVETDINNTKLNCKVHVLSLLN